MNLLNSSRIRLGILALPIQSILGIISISIRGPFIDPAANPSTFAQAASSTFFPAAILGAIGVMLLSLSFLALYAYLSDGTSEQPAFWGMIFSLVGGWFTLPLIGVFSFALPTVGQLYLQGQTNVIEVAVAFWRKGNLPKWVVILYVVSIPLFYFAPPAPFVVEFLGMILFFVAGSFVAYHVWQQPALTS